MIHVSVTVESLRKMKSSNGFGFACVQFHGFCASFKLQEGFSTNVYLEHKGDVAQFRLRREYCLARQRSGDGFDLGRAEN